MAAGAGCSSGPPSDLQAIICRITMPLCNVSQQKRSDWLPCLLLFCSNLLHTPVQQSCSEFHFTSSLMTSCPHRFLEHPSSSEKEGRKRGMKNEADRWSLQVLIHFDAEDSEASQKVSEWRKPAQKLYFMCNRCWSVEWVEDQLLVDEQLLPQGTVSRNQVKFSEHHWIELICSREILTQRWFSFP